jgi:alpha-beta hydrolase superfamily lysophospholipase
MSRWKKLGLGVVVVLVLGASAGAAIVTRNEAHRLGTNPAATRKVSGRTPASIGLAFTDETVTSSDGFRLHGWYVPGTRPALIIVQHGYKDRLESYINMTRVLNKHGFHVLIQTVRAHDKSDGEQLYFGLREMPDMEAWHQFAKTRPGVDPARIGMIGISMGGSLAIQYTATHPDIAALVADSAFSSLLDTIDTSVRHFSGLPPFPFSPMIRFWMEREFGFTADEVDAKKWIGLISPRPVLVMQGGADTVVSVTSGERLFALAGEPKESWFEPSVGHAQFLKMMPDEFERRVTGFFDKHLK